MTLSFCFCLVVRVTSTRSQKICLTDRALSVEIISVNTSPADHQNQKFITTLQRPAVTFKASTLLRCYRRRDSVSVILIRSTLDFHLSPCCCQQPQRQYCHNLSFLKVYSPRYPVSLGRLVHNFIIAHHRTPFTTIMKSLKLHGNTDTSNWTGKCVVLHRQHRIFECNIDSLLHMKISPSCTGRIHSLR